MFSSPYSKFVKIQAHNGAQFRGFNRVGEVYLPHSGFAV